MDSVPLKEHIEAILAEKDKALAAALTSAKEAVNAALAASEKAVAKAEAEAKEWRNNANEWRGAMSDREKTFATKAEAAVLKERADLGQGKGQGIQQFIGWILAAIAIIGYLTK